MAKKQTDPKKEPVVEAEAPKKEARKVAKKPEGVWRCNLYIRGYGRVNEGDSTTAEAVAMLKDPSKYVV